MTTAVADQSIDSFLRFMSLEKGTADATVEAYRSDLTQFLSLLPPAIVKDNSANWQRVAREIVVSYIGELKKLHYAKASVARKVAAVKSFFQYLHTEGVIMLNPTETLESPCAPKTPPKPLSVRQIGKLLEQPAKRKTPDALRDHAMMELLYATGLRVTELVSLDLDSISTHLYPPRVHCLGKKAKDRTIPINDRALHTLEVYLNEGRAKLVKNKKERALFVNHRGDRLARQGFWLILKQYAREAGIVTLVTPNTLRRSFATHMLRSGAPLRYVQELMGHANISTTKKYAKIGE